MPLRVQSMPIPSIHGAAAHLGKTLNVPHVYQVLDNWCWAACAEMVLRYYSMTITKCAVAGWLKQNPSCCIMNPPAVCKDTCTVTQEQDDIAAIYHHYGLSANRKWPVASEDLKNEVEKNNPVELCYRMARGGHVIVVYGWYPTPSGAYRFRIHDPLNDASAAGVTFEGLIQNQFMTLDTT